MFKVAGKNLKFVLKTIALGLVMLIPGFLAFNLFSVPNQAVDFNTDHSQNEESITSTISSVIAPPQVLAADSLTANIIPVSTELATPFNNQMYKVLKRENKAIGFIAIGSSAQNNLLYQAAYRKMGTSTWKSFGTNPAYAPNGTMTVPNNVTNAYTDANGWTCRMSFGSNPPPNCTTGWTYNNLTVKAAVSGAPIYFPGITLPPGNYEWTSRSKVNGYYPNPWTTPKRFSIMELPTVVNSLYVPYQKKIAITFDDGPNYTQGLCPILNRYNAKATFFYVATRLAEDPEAYKYAESCGEVQSHTYNHTAYGTNTNYATMYNDIVKANSIFKKITGKTPRWLRVRGGVYNSSIIDAALGSHMGLVNWNIKVNDYGPDNPTRAQIVSRVLNDPNLKPGAIILLHETYTPTREALPTILSELKNRGYTVTTVSDLVDSSR